MTKKVIRLKSSTGDRTYPIGELDFTNVCCDLEEYGIDIMGNLDGKLMSFCRAIVAICTGETDKKNAGLILTEHIKNGGKLSDIYDVFHEAMEDAGFGSATEETATEEQTEQPKKRK
ncbi:MAG: hypothetical protein IKN54_06210 [Lachnospiraceae bacterium]|nr:hypothetical protein [Lachnospiraceae bacterium]